MDLSGSGGARGSATIAAVLTQVRKYRARTGRPHWLVIDGAERLLHDPDIPPEALDLSERGHCLVLRDHAQVPVTIAAGADVVLACASGCPLSSHPMAGSSTT